jgi:hypothetical protein
MSVGLSTTNSNLTSLSTALGPAKFINAMAHATAAAAFGAL